MYLQGNQYRIMIKATGTIIMNIYLVSLMHNMIVNIMKIINIRSGGIGKNLQNHWGC